MEIELDGKLFFTKEPMIWIYALDRYNIGISRREIKAWSKHCLYVKKINYKRRGFNIVVPLPEPFSHHYCFTERGIRDTISYSPSGNYALMTLRSK